MSGIAGYVGIEAGVVSETVLRRMARQLEHRGPDGERIVVHGRVGLVHRRLAATDRTAGGQPVRSTDGRYLMVYDGEVHDWRERHAELAALGHPPAPGDAEVLLAAWQRWGAAGLDRCNGGFALAILDTITGTLTLARDPTGEVPLYLAADGSGRVAFASEPRAVIAAGVVPRRADELTVYRYLSLGAHDDTERTFFDRVTRVLPGQLVVVPPTGEPRRETYTGRFQELDRLATGPRPGDPAARERIVAALTAAVRLRLAGAGDPAADPAVGDLAPGDLAPGDLAPGDRAPGDPAPGDPAAGARAPVGLALSGGPASAALLAVVQRLWTAPEPPVPMDLPIVAVDPTGGGADRPGPLLQPDPERFVDDLPDLVRTQQEPAAAAAYLHYRLLREAGRRVSVVLDGPVGDALLAARLAHQRDHPSPRWVPVADRLRRRRSAVAGRRRRSRSATGTQRDHPSPRWVPVADRLRRRRPATADRLLAVDFAAAHAATRPDPAADRPRRSAADLFQHRLPAALRYADRNRPRFSVAGRVPFLDPHLLRVLWSLDPAWPLHPGGGRRPAGSPTGWPGTGPAPVAPLPDHRSARTRELVSDLLGPASLSARPYLDRAAVTAVVESYLAGRVTGPDVAVLWRLLDLELWLREFIDRDPSIPPAATFVGHYPRSAAGPYPPVTPPRREPASDREQPADRAPGSRRDEASPPEEASRPEGASRREPRPAGREPGTRPVPTGR